MKTRHQLVWLAAAIAMMGCGPSDQRKAELAEKKRIECLDKFCEGDVEPERNIATEVALKINGQWYVGPKAYYGSKAGAVFYWPSKTPEIGLPDGQPYPEKGLPFSDVAVEVFLKGRHRWPIASLSGVEKPWELSSWDVQWKKMVDSGMEMTRNEMASELDIVRFTQADGSPYRMTYFVAKKHRIALGGHPPVAVCDTAAHPKNRCTGGFYVFDGAVHADFRFNAKHANDWPAIYQEISSVIQQLRRI